MLFISYLVCRRVVIVASYLQQKIIISYRTSVLCVCAYNDFGQQHSALVTPATKAMTHAAYTGRVVSRMPRACPHLTKTLKHSNMLQSNNTRDTELLHKACTKARASSMTVHNQCNEIKNITRHLFALTHATKATAHEIHCCCTRHIPRRVPRPCPCTISVMKSRT